MVCTPMTMASAVFIRWWSTWTMISKACGKNPKTFKDAKQYLSNPTATLHMRPPLKKKHVVFCLFGIDLEAPQKLTKFWESVGKFHCHSPSTTILQIDSFYISICSYINMWNPPLKWPKISRESFTNCSTGTGGELEFPDDIYSFKPSAGTAVLFPHDMPHTALEVFSGTKYASRRNWKLTIEFWWEILWKISVKKLLNVGKASKQAILWGSLV